MYDRRASFEHHATMVTKRRSCMLCRAECHVFRLAMSGALAGFPAAAAQCSASGLVLVVLFLRCHTARSRDCGAGRLMAKATT